MKMDSCLKTENNSAPDRPEHSNDSLTETNEGFTERNENCTKLTEEFSDESREQLIDHTDLDSIAPDGGWGWVVCFASFLINVIADGTFFSFGILLIDLLDFFHESRSKTAWIGSTLLGMSMIMGPVVSFLLKFYSCRQIVISGTLITVVSFIASVFSPSVDVLIITYGFIAGIGTGMIFIPAIIIVGLYFNKKRAIATGIATSGAGVGVFVYGYLCEYLLEQFDWRGTILILAGILLNCAACGAVFRPIVEQKLKRRLRLIKEKEREQTSASNELKNEQNILDRNITLKEKKYLFPGEQNDYETSTKGFSNQLRLYKSAQHLSNLCEQNVGDSPRTLSNSCHLIQNGDENNRTSLNYVSKHDFEHIKHGLLRPMLRKDIYYSGSVQQLPDYKHCGSLTSFLAEMTRESSVEDSRSSYSSKLTSCWDKLVDKTNLWLFKDPIFVLLLVVYSMWAVQSVTLTYFPDMAVSKGIHRSQAAILISIVGVTNTLGRIIAGFFHDMLHIKGTTLYIVALFTAAVVNFVIPQFNQFSWLAACAGVFGFCMAVAVSMRTIVLTEQLGIEQLTASFGLVALFQGITFMLDPPIAGKLYAINTSYTYPYIMAGAMYLLSCICSVVISCMRHHSKPDTTDIVVSVER